MHRHTAGSRASTKFLHRPARSLRRTISLLSTFGAVAGVQLQTSRSIKPRERDLGDLRLFFLARFLTRPTNHPRHAACASNFKSKPVRPRNFEGRQYSRCPRFRKGREAWDDRAHCRTVNAVNCRFETYFSPIRGLAASRAALTDIQENTWGNAKGKVEFR